MDWNADSNTSAGMDWNNGTNTAMEMDSSKGNYQPNTTPGMDRSTRGSPAPRPGNTRSSRTSEHYLSLTGFAGAILWISIGALVLFIVSFATTGWYTWKVDDVRMEAGLWETCACSNYKAQTATVRTTQAFSVLALIALIAATGMAFCYLLLHSFSKHLMLLGALGSFIAAAIFILIAVAVFGSENQNYQGHLSFSFAFACITIFICIAGAAVTFLQMRKSGTI